MLQPNHAWDRTAFRRYYAALRSTARPLNANVGRPKELNLAMATRDPFPMRSPVFCRRIALKAVFVRFTAAVLLLAGAVAAEAQPVYRVGFVSPIKAVPEPVQLRAFRQGLRELGYVEGTNLIIEARFAEGKNERLPELVAELVRLKVDVLLAGSTLGTVVAKRTITTVPIVFAGVQDPVGAGIVATLARPGGNVTGIAMGVGGGDFTAKCLELLTEAAPGTSHVAVLLNPAYPLSTQVRGEVQAVGRALNLKFDVHEAGNLKDLESVFGAIDASGARALFVAPDQFLTDSSPRIARFATEKRLPAIHFSKRFADAGGLMSYGASLENSYRRAASHVDKILKGAKPFDLPVEQPTRFELVINLKTARAIGLKVPQSVLLRADHTIE